MEFLYKKCVQSCPSWRIQSEYPFKSLNLPNNWKKNTKAMAEKDQKLFAVHFRNIQFLVWNQRKIADFWVESQVLWFWCKFEMIAQTWYILKGKLWKSVSKPDQARFWALKIFLKVKELRTLLGSLYKFCSRVRKKKFRIFIIQFLINLKLLRINKIFLPCEVVSLIFDTHLQSTKKNYHVAKKHTPPSSKQSTVCSSYKKEFPSYYSFQHHRRKKMERNNGKQVIRW